MSSTTKLVKIERSAFGAQFQVVRALLSAASALVASDNRRAIEFIDDALVELSKLKLSMGGAS